MFQTPTKKLNTENGTGFSKVNLTYYSYKLQLHLFESWEITGRVLLNVMDHM